ncbi:tRNA (adenine(22)-N(1))-methyltransferase TrmK [Exiguobacterium antarcticum]|uniref:tRNA (Adenine(22)-N(1))-methyltransferase TrmK n=3 Tax=Bacillales Family XII. Incertae Sedis TaxID=539742 RepID=A0ABT6QZQ9_9BACL|nr:tRNA (adenine(22)-N(1))-methyltransferase TrmK [Exiguobacterium antarcticum]MDI3234073.1 tRNA (adenine(22)-N(1))-methyltransferase TrmK [Exiguobacterium antarcticum]
MKEMQTNVILDQRLQKVVSYIPQGAVLADIGSDHAFVPCYCIQQNLVERAIAGEVNLGPMEAAQAQVALVQLEEKIEVRLGSGLTVLRPGEATAITIAGMGGTLIATILEEGKTHLSGEERLILQPNVDAVDVRKWLLANGYALLSEAIVKENEKIYEILVAQKGEESLYADNLERREWELFFGPQLTREKAPAFVEKWQTEKQKRQYILEQMRRGNDSEVLQGKIETIERLIQKMDEVTG